jgi:hypothetical protein
MLSNAVMRKEKDEYRVYVASLYKAWLRYIRKWKYADTDVFEFAEKQREQTDTVNGVEPKPLDILLLFLGDFLIWAKSDMGDNKKTIRVIGQFASVYDLLNTDFSELVPYFDEYFAGWPEKKGRFEGTTAEYLESAMLEWFRQGGLYLTERDVVKIMHSQSVDGGIYYG